MATEKFTLIAVEGGVQFKVRESLNECWRRIADAIRKGEAAEFTGAINGRPAQISSYGCERVLAAIEEEWDPQQQAALRALQGGIAMPAGAVPAGVVQR